MTQGRADRAIEAAIAARLREGPSGVVAIVSLARKAAPEIHRHEGAIHAILHRLARRGTIAPVGHGEDGGVLWAAGPKALSAVEGDAPAVPAGAAIPGAADPSVVPPPSATANESRIAVAVARGVRDPLDRGRVAADVLAHLRALRADGRLTRATLEAFGSLSQAKSLLARVDRGRSPICVAADSGERVRRFVAHEGPSIAITLAALLLVKLFVAEPRNVPSHSMEPTLKPGDRVIVSKIGGKREPDRWAVVVFERPRDGQVLVKRAVGLGGETIKIDDFGDVLVNGRRLVKPDAVNEAVKERLAVAAPEDPRNAADWVAAEKRPGVRRYARALFADEPVYGDDQGRPEPLLSRPLLHDLYLEATAVVPATGAAGIEVTWTPMPGKSDPTTEPTTIAVLVSAGPGATAGSSVPVALSLVDGVLRTRRGERRTVQEGVLPKGAAGIAVVGEVRGLRLHRDIHWTRPAGTSSELDPSASSEGLKVPEWHVFFLGDHSTNSRDSRYPTELGPVPLDHLIGPVVFRVWPPSRIGPVH